MSDHQSGPEARLRVAGAWLLVVCRHRAARPSFYPGHAKRKGPLFHAKKTNNPPLSGSADASGVTVAESRRG